MIAVRDPAPAPQKRECAVCHHAITVYGVNEWRCLWQCRCLMLGCVPQPTSPNRP